MDFGLARRRSTWLVAGALGVGAFALLRATTRRTWGEARPLPSGGGHVVILGAGFAGLTAARTLRRRLGRRGHITLVDRQNYHLFTSLLFQVATGDVDPYDIAYHIRESSGHDGIDFVKGTVAGIDLKGRRVRLEDREIDYDYLIVALGSTTNYLGNRSAVEHALPLKRLGDGIALRHRVLDSLEEAARTADPVERQALLTIVVVGGGATGVETAAALAVFLRRVVPASYPSLAGIRPRVLVLESTNRLLGQLDERLAEIALDRLRAEGVEVWLNSRAGEVGPRQVTTLEAETIPTRTVVWVTGVRAPEVVALLDAPHGRGGALLVDELLQVRGYPGVFAVGDNAHVESRPGGGPIPQLAQSAEKTGAAAAENVARAIEGRPGKPFRFRSLGCSIILGRSSGALGVAGIAANGIPGWLAWRVIHLIKNTGLRGRLGTALSWALEYVAPPNTVRIEVEPRQPSPPS